MYDDKNRNTKNKIYIQEQFEVDKIGLFDSYSKDKQTK